MFLPSAGFLTGASANASVLALGESVTQGVVSIQTSMQEFRQARAVFEGVAVVTYKPMGDLADGQPTLKFKAEPIERNMNIDSAALWLISALTLYQAFKAGYDRTITVSDKPRLSVNLTPSFATVVHDVLNAEDKTAATIVQNIIESLKIFLRDADEGDLAVNLKEKLEDYKKSRRVCEKTLVSPAEPMIEYFTTADGQRGITMPATIFNTHGREAVHGLRDGIIEIHLTFNGKISGRIFKASDGIIATTLLAYYPDLPANDGIRYEITFIKRDSQRPYKNSFIKRFIIRSGDTIICEATCVNKDEVGRTRKVIVENAAGRKEFVHKRGFNGKIKIYQDDEPVIKTNKPQGEKISNREIAAVVRELDKIQIVVGEWGWVNRLYRILTALENAGYTVGVRNLRSALEGLDTERVIAVKKNAEGEITPAKAESAIIKKIEAVRRELEMLVRQGENAFLLRRVSLR